MLNYLKTAIFHPKEIYTGRNMKNSHFLAILLIITLLLSLFSLPNFSLTFQEIQDDFNEIKQSIPEFEIIDNELQSDGESYIYQTDSMIFYFDTKGHVTPDLINKNMANVSVPVSVGLLYKEIYVNLLGQIYNFAYEDYPSLSTEFITSFIYQFGTFSGMSRLLFIIPIFLSQFLSYFYQLLMIALVANFISLFAKPRLRILQILKVTTLANVIPVLTVHAFSAFISPIYFRLEIILILTAFIFYISLKEMNKRIHEKK